VGIDIPRQKNACSWWNIVKGKTEMELFTMRQALKPDDFRLESNRLITDSSHKLNKNRCGNSLGDRTNRTKPTDRKVFGEGLNDVDITVRINSDGQHTTYSG